MQPFANRVRQIARGLSSVTAVLLVQQLGVTDVNATTCTPPANANKIVVENCLQGNPPSQWDIVGAGDPSIQGFATDISVNHGQTIQFKIKTPSTNYHIDIYRLGWYGGDGARKVAGPITPSASLPQSQPACLTNADPNIGLTDCGNWAVSASWPVPATAVSGTYIAKLIRDDATGASHIVFIVRDDEGQSDLLFQTADTTWQAYNRYGGNSLYFSSTLLGRAYKVSYNRPFSTRDYSDENWLFNSEYPLTRWLEKNGYDVSYFTGIDSARFPSEIWEHKIFLSTGHDEYWSDQQRTNVDDAARLHGVHLAFLSGNDVFWKIRWENSTDGSNTPYRTLTCYKETHSDAKIDPTTTWTGTWRDPRFSPPSDGGRPENGLTGTIFTANADATSSIEVPPADRRMRFWRNAFTLLPADQTALLPFGVLGYEWNEDLDNGFRPGGQIRLSTTTRTVARYIQDWGTNYAPGTATHHLTLHRNGTAIVFSAGTIQWAWGLDDTHDRFTSSAVSADMKQATINLFADMGVQPQTMEGGLSSAGVSTDTSAPTSTITSPAPGAVLPISTPVTVTGTAADTGGGAIAGVVGGVEVSTDGGATWHPATGRESWTYTFTPRAPQGPITIKSRATDDSLNGEAPSAGVTVNVGAPLPVTCPCSIWSPSVTVGEESTDPSPVNLGVKFRADVNGYIKAIRFYKYADNGGTHTAYLWTAAGALLASATFTAESASGWQQVALNPAVAITANTVYIATYHTPSGRFAVSRNYFITTGVDSPPLHAFPENGANGVYVYGSAGIFPGSTFAYSNYWVDVVFDSVLDADTTPPTVISRSPGVGATGIDPNANVDATFSEVMDATGINGTTTNFLLQDNATNAVVAASVTYIEATRTARLNPTSALAPFTTYKAIVKGAPSGVKDTAGNMLAADVQWTFTTGAASSYSCPCSLWNEAPGTGGTESSNGTAVNLGVKFQSDVSGYIKGIRFYKHLGNIGVHTALLFTVSGTELARATFTAESASGWQEVSFDPPFPINDGATYVAAYHTPSGHWAETRPNYFSSEYVNAPLRALAYSLASPNSVYAYGGAGVFPDSDPGDAPNYWIDVVFDTNAGPVNNAPVAANDSYTVAEGGTLNITAPGVLGNDTDVDSGTTLTAIKLSDPLHGTLTFNSSGSFTYVHDGSETLSDSFTYKANDGTADSNVGTVNITVTAVNDPPVAVNDSYTVAEGGTLNIAAAGVLANDADVDGGALTAIKVTDPAHGTVTLNANGSFTYIHDGSETTSDSFTYKANDGAADSNIATVSITITPVNDAPVAVNDTYSTNEDTALTIAAPGVLGNDTDAEGNPLTAALVTNVAHGTLALNANGSFTYTPAANYNGPDSFTYRANDGTLNSNTVTVSITINAVNDPPAAANDSYTTNEDTPLTVATPGVLTNDTDVEGSALTAVLATSPAHGSLTLNANGSFTYTPAANYSGTDTFTYKANDGSADSAPATVTINITAVNDAPVAVDDTYSTNEDTVLSPAAPGVLTNDVDADGNTLTPTLLTSTTHGTLTLNANGSFTYTPAANYNGPDSFTYRVSDGLLNSNTATVNITVVSVNDPPIANNDTSSTYENLSVKIVVLANDSDPDGDTLTVTSTSTPTNGSVSINGDGSLQYAPNLNFNGTDAFTYTVSDGQGGTATATVNMTVRPVNSAPIANPDSYSTNEDSTLNVAAPGVLANDVDPEGDAKTATFVSGPANGTLTLNANGSFTYTPNANYNGSDTFKYTAQDSGLVTSTDDTRMDFLAGTIGTCTAVTLDAGEVMLTPAAPGLVETFSGTTVPTGWTTSVKGGGSATVSGGLMTVNGATARLDQTYTPTAGQPKSVEFSATFASATTNQQIGFGTGNANNILTSGDWVMFSTSPTGDQLYARTKNGSTQVTTGLGPSSLGTHRFRIEWSTTDVNYYVDGVLRATHGPSSTPAITPPTGSNIRFAVNDDTVGGNAVSIHWMRIGPYNASCIFTSRVFFGDSGTWQIFNATTNVPTATNIVFEVHSGNTESPDGSWSPFATQSGTTITGQTGKYLQYRATLSTTDGNSPSLEKVDVSAVLLPSEATVTITVNSVDDAPVATNDSYSTNEGTTLTVAAPGVLGNDTDVDTASASLTASQITGPLHGTLTLNANGSFTYVHDGSETTTDSFTYKVSDGTSFSNVATVTITVTPVNDAPVANNDSYTVAEGGTLNITAPGVLGNDTDADSPSASLTASQVTGPTHGTLTLNANGSFTYVHDSSETTTDSFTYRTSDGSANSNTATVTITITPVNDAPVAANDSYTAAEGGTLNPAAPGVLGNDTDPDGPSKTAILVSGPAHTSSFTLTADGSFTYVHDGGETTTDSFTYKVSDGSLESNVATVTITITPVNDPPVANNDSYTVAEAGTLNITAPGVLGNDTDADSPSASLTASQITGPLHGTLTLNANGSFTYVHDGSETTTDSFTYKVSDGSANSNTATVTIIVTPVNDAPVAANDSYTIAEGGTLNPAAPGVLGNDTDPDGPSKTAIVVSGPAHASSFTLNADGSFTYVHDGGETTTDSFTYKVSDGLLESNVVTVTIAITPVNDPPVANNDGYTVAEGGTLNITTPGVLGNDTDVDTASASLTASQVSGPLHGTLTLNANGSFTYTHDGSETLSDSFTYSVSDGSANSNTATVTITVTPVNDAPAAVNDSYTVAEGGTLNITAPGVLGNDTDADSPSASLTASQVTGPTHGTLTL
ncbi:MAG TPA: Ig-like domain-containing protein, partial [Thermoanaerobaculia bacterium]